MAIENGDGTNAEELHMSLLAETSSLMSIAELPMSCAIALRLRSGHAALGSILTNIESLLCMGGGH